MNRVDDEEGVAMKPLFIPLRRRWFDAFASGQKTEEWRRYSKRWDENACTIGRPVILSLGYSGARLNGTICGYNRRECTGSSIYPDGTLCSVISINVDRSG